VEKKVQELKSRLLEITDINLAGALLAWDQATYMPSGGAAARGRQMAALGRIGHEKLTDPKLGKLLDDLQVFGERLPYNDDDAAIIRVAKKNYDRATKVPAELMGQMQEHSAAAYQVWATARPENDFATVQPYLEKTLELSRQIANCFPGYDHIADPLIDFSDEGMKAESVRQVFAELREQLVPIVQTIGDQEVADDSCLREKFPEDEQLAFGKATPHFG